MKRVYSVLIRYAILLIIAFPNLWLFYKIFTPLTVYPVYFFLDMFYNASLSGNIVILENLPIYLVKACIAGSAYYLLLILNLTTLISTKKRICSLLFSSLLFLIVNIFRIFIFSVFLINSFSLFNLMHLISWYFLSSVIVVLIWIATIRVFKIREIPVYSDFNFLRKN